MRRIEIRTPDNWHCHLRQGPLLLWMVEMLLRSGFLGRNLAMPNLKPREVLTGPEGLAYKTDIDAGLAHHAALGTFIPVMTIQITEGTAREVMRKAYECGVKVGKAYPRNVTTNSERGVLNYVNICPALDQAQASGMIVCFHGEHPSYDVEGLFKEGGFIGILEEIRTLFPYLKIVVEHITTRKMRDWVGGQDPKFVRATITAHHLALTLDDIIGYSERSGGLMRVHNGCKPQPKFRDDLIALQEAAMSGDPHFFYGGDDAAHLRSKKECDGAACGVFNTTVALPYLVQLFNERDAIAKLGPFLSEFGADFYGYPRSEGSIVIEENDWVIPPEYPVPGTNDSVVSLFAGETMHWQVRL